MYKKNKTLFFFAKKKNFFRGKKSARGAPEPVRNFCSHIKSSAITRGSGRPDQNPENRVFSGKNIFLYGAPGGGGGTRVLPSGFSTIFAKKWFLRLYDRFAQKPEKVKFRRFLQKMCKISTLFCTLFCTFAHVWSPYQKCIF